MVQFPEGTAQSSLKLRSDALTSLNITTFVFEISLFLPHAARKSVMLCLHMERINLGLFVQLEERSEQDFVLNAETRRSISQPHNQSDFVAGS